MTIYQAEVQGVRIVKKDSLYVNVSVAIADDSGLAYYSDGVKCENALVRREDYEKEPDKFAVGQVVKCFYSASEKDGKKRYFFNIV